MPHLEIVQEKIRRTQLLFYRCSQALKVTVSEDGSVAGGRGLVATENIVKAGFISLKDCILLDH